MSAPGILSAIVAITSLNLTAILVNDYDVVAKTWPITAATATTPITVTSPAHGVPTGRVVHGVVSGVVGTTEANGLWILTPLDANTFALSLLTAQGIPEASVGVNAYVSGGTISTPFPDYRILMGRRMLGLASATATPRIVMVPTAGRAWGFEPYGGAGPSLQPAQRPPVRGSVEQQSMTLAPQLATQFPTFEVYVSATAKAYGGETSQPDDGDFDATTALVFALYSVLFDETGGTPRAKVLREDWPSQKVTSGSMTQLGQTWMGIVEFQQGVSKLPLQFVPIGTTAELAVAPVNAASGDSTTITFA